MTMTDIIKNKKDLGTDGFREDALEILEAGYQAVVTEKILTEKIFLQKDILKIDNKKYNLKDYKKIFVIAVGKSANTSAKILEDILGDRITEGIVLDVEKSKFKGLISKVGTHPLPSDQNIEATKSIIEVLKKARKDDLIISLISGGGSSLLCLPTEGVDCDYLKQITSTLMQKGATIGETNIIRKHLSKIKGGYFATLVSPAKLVSVLFSDVPGDDISMIASGPTVFDKTTKNDAQMILEAYSLGDLRSPLTSAMSFLSETPKTEDSFKSVDNILLLTNIDALEAMETKAEELGYNAIIQSSDIQGEASRLARQLVGEEPLDKTCQIFGGETTVQIKGTGKGGRNQEFVLSALNNLPKDVLVVAVASDGWDNTDVAGALVDENTIKEVNRQKISIEDYLVNNDSYEFFKKIGGHIKTGRTGINVADFYLIIKK